MAFEGIVVAEGEFEKAVSFQTREELDAYEEGVMDAANWYGAGSCCIYTLDDLKDDWLEEWERELITKHLGAKGEKH